jgi:hypothetical protein
MDNVDVFVYLYEGLLGKQCLTLKLFTLNKERLNNNNKKIVITNNKRCAVCLLSIVFAN